jgi:DNA-binding transcriptional LysR family regulator
MIDIRTIQHALAVARFGNFRKAAESLYLTQPTLTRSIQALEETLGVKLFDRGRKKVEPTPLGLIFLSRAEKIIKATAELKREIDLARGLEIGNLEIGSGVGPAELLMGTAVGRLSQRYPQLYIHVTVDDFLVLTNLLQSGQIELFVAETSELEISSDFLVTPLNVLRAYLFCRRGHPLLDRLPHLTLKETLEYPLVMTRLPRRAVDSIAEMCGIKNHSDDLRELPIIRCDYVAMGKAIVASSNAVAFILLPMIERELKSGEFVLLPVDFPELKTHYGVVQLRDRTLSPPTEVFITLIQELDTELARKDKELRETMFSKIGDDHKEPK